jgi:hypothetical protein
MKFTAKIDNTSFGTSSADHFKPANKDNNTTLSQNISADTFFIISRTSKGLDAQNNQSLTGLLSPPTQSSSAEKRDSWTVHHLEDELLLSITEQPHIAMLKSQKSNPALYAPLTGSPSYARVTGLDTGLINKD